jgi:hypothetical protein
MENNNIGFAVVEPEYLPPLTLNDAIETLLESIGTHQISLATNYVKLGILLLQAKKDKKYGNHTSFPRYLGYVGERIKRQRSQIYAYVGIAERLLPAVSEANLEQMGISKASELAKYVKCTGLKSIAPKLLELALDGTQTVERLQAEVQQELHIKPDEKGKWRNWGGGYLTDSEQEEYDTAYTIGRNKLLPSVETPEHVVRKEIMLMWAREFISSNPEEVE